MSMDKDIDTLKDRVFQILQGQTSGITENHLLKLLRDDGEDEGSDGTSGLYQLFHDHFHLFHVLYKLRDELFRQQQGYLVISPLNIEIQPFDSARRQDLAEHDALQEFYSNLSNLEKIDPGLLARWVGKFWAGVPANEKRKQALTTLGLQDPVDDKTIKEQYRRLAMRHHPDRGGDAETLQSINLAMQILSGEI